MKKKVQKFSVIIEREDGWYIAECPALPGCVSQGRMLKEALKNIREAIELGLPVCSGAEAIGAFERAGGRISRQKGRSRFSAEVWFTSSINGSTT